jgi:NADH-quinone oxidoreductase subunit M
MTNLPLLSLLIGLPLLGALVLGLGQLKEQARTIAIGLSTLQLALLGYIYSAFDKTSGLFQFNETHHWFSISLGSMGQFMSKYTLGIDGLSISLLLLTGLITWVALWNSTEIKEKIGGYYALVLLLNASIMGCFMAKDLFLFYVFFEFMLLPMYFLIGIWGGPRRNYASLKFFLYTLVGSLLILIVMLGMGIAYVDPYETALLNGLIRPEQDFNVEALKTVQQLIQSQELATSSLVHSFDIQALSDLKNCQITSILHISSGWQLAGMSAREWGFWLLFIGFAIKLPMVPLHTWLPDAHVEAPTPISVLLAGVLLKIGAYGWLRITIPFFQIEALMAANILSGLGALSIIYGAYNALAMTDLKKLVAYSSVSHMGFVLLGIAAFTAEGWQGAIFQTISHGVLSALLFLIVGVLYSRTGNREIDSYSGLVTLMPRFTVISGIAIFASLGLPGFSGFIGEFFSLLGAFSSPFVHPVIALFGALGLLLGAGYLLWTFQKIYLGKHYQKNADWSLPDLNKLELLSLFGLGIISILLGVYPGLLFELSEKFVTGLLK